MSPLPIRIERRMGKGARVELAVEMNAVALTVLSLAGGTVFMSPAEARWLATSLNGMAQRAESPPEGA